MVFYSTPLFVSLGLGQDSAFLSSVITGVVFVAATVVAVFTVDRFGRRVRAAAAAPLAPVSAFTGPRLCIPGGGLLGACRVLASQVAIV